VDAELVALQRVVERGLRADLRTSDAFAGDVEERALLPNGAAVGANASAHGLVAAADEAAQRPEAGRVVALANVGCGRQAPVECASAQVRGDVSRLLGEAALQDAFSDAAPARIDVAGGCAFAGDLRERLLADGTARVARRCVHH